jgi:hypothetical protein
MFFFSCYFLHVVGCDFGGDAMEAARRLPDFLHDFFVMFRH